jgi:argininosuccinate synthase
MLQAAIDEAQKPVTGTARIKLYKGNATVAGRRADKSLFDPGIASFEEAGGYRQSDATGFISLNGLRLRLRKLKQG